MAIKTFLFDLGNVLLFFSHEKMCQQVGDLCGKTGADIRRLMFQDQKILDIDRGSMSNQEVQNWIEDDTGSSLNERELLLALSDIFVPNETMFPILDTLKSRGHRLVLLSNTNAFHIEFVREKYDILDKFDHLILSYEHGAVKSEEAIYRAAADVIQCSPDECFYTDDISEYVEAARNYGFQAEVFTTTSAFREQMKTRDPGLAELL